MRPSRAGETKANAPIPIGVRKAATMRWEAFFDIVVPTPASNDT